MTTPADSPDLATLMAGIDADLLPSLRGSGDRFPSAAKLIKRFEAASDQLRTSDWDGLPAFEEAHNEMCIAALILEDPEEPTCRLLEYEPPIDGCERRFDFRADFDGAASCWVEVKTIHPRLLDGWETYEEARENGRFPSDARLVLDRSWLGGELFHNSYASRSRMLAYTIDTERKITACLPDERGPVFLALCSNGFDWHIDELEDFVYFYRYGTHAVGDVFRLMEEHYIDQKGIELERTIDHFAFIKRPSDAVRAVGGVWQVKPVHFSPERGFFRT